MSQRNEARVKVGDCEITVLRSGAGRPLVILHDELGFPGWMRWNDDLDHEFEQVVPLQPGFGVTPEAPWLLNYRDVADLYLWMLRDQGLEQFDLMGFSAGGYIAAEMAVASRERIEHLVLVAPLGVKPTEGQILDFLAMTPRSHVAATVSQRDAEEFGKIYGGEMSSEQFELFAAARAETSRLGWAPFMHNLSLPMRIESLGTLPTLIVWGDADQVVPRSAMDRYADGIPLVRLEVIEGVGHRPEIESPVRFVQLVSDFLGRKSLTEPMQSVGGIQAAGR